MICPIGLIHGTTVRVVKLMIKLCGPWHAPGRLRAAASTRLGADPLFRRAPAGSGVHRGRSSAATARHPDPGKPARVADGRTAVRSAENDGGNRCRGIGAVVRLGQAAMAS
jgi:hypothetical protein